MDEAATVVRREGRLPEHILEGGLRHHTARGTIVNAAFQIGFAGLGLLRRLIVAAFLTASEFGIWGALLGALFVVAFIKDAGLSDKFIQQDEEDQERAFQRFFSLDLLLSFAVIVLAVIALPIFALAYGKADIIAPGLVLSLAVIASSFEASTAVFYRRMDFVRQRVLQAVDPVVGFTVTVGLAVAGASYWSLVIGALSGSVAGGVVAARACPYRFRFRFEWSTAREYFHFSWPLVINRGESMLGGQAAMIIAARTIGIAATGAIGLAATITQFTRGVDMIVTQTIYPAVCAVRHRKDLLLEAFVKSNRLALMWGLPFGFGLALFAQDLVHFVIGEKWHIAIVLLQAFGVITAVDQLGFNWTAFLRALNHTRPLAVLSLLDIVVFALVSAPLLIAFGLTGFAIGSLFSEAVGLAGRTYYLGKIFPTFVILRQAVRAFVPVMPAVAAVAVARLLESGERTALTASSELILFVGLTVAATALFERRLLREVIGYLRRRTGSQAARPSIQAAPAQRGASA
ncbi:MAG: oligosaccharide flippase family protein [Thermoleophilaceae bacterium]